MGRKVCFIDEEGQVGTCLRDDEDCFRCNFGDAHFKWLKEETKYDVAEKVFMKMPDNDYDMEKISKQVHVLEQTVYGLRDLASALRRTGFGKVSEELDWRAGNIEEVMEKTDQLILAFLKQERKNLEIENTQLKRINENIDRKMR